MTHQRHVRLNGSVESNRSYGTPRRSEDLPKSSFLAVLAEEKFKRRAGEKLYDRLLCAGFLIRSVETAIV